MNVYEKAHSVDKDTFVAQSASVIGDVQVGASSYIWYGCVLRGDVNSISIGSDTNIQDRSLVHVAKSNLLGKVHPTVIGYNVIVGHIVVLHGCTVEDEAFVGMKATFLERVVVWGGNPVKFLRKLKDEDIAFISQSAANYASLAQVHADQNAKPLDKIEFLKVFQKKVNEAPTFLQ
ncbi:hypothetical protein L2E82_46807 [Cichorium intybus]|uniref:Uncharacterized protein n=1 Tax=Cichorium intybus TaxID=13427 RepID=A0ACB8YT26_CICIN|nr:hypothetical protein L2E82_46807 [Cichorium intybus]